MHQEGLFLSIISWIAVIVLAISYWFQIIKIHIHKEVRDLSVAFNVLLAIGFGILTFSAYVERSTIFFTKQVLTTIPVLIIIGQILYHRDDRWHDHDDPKCSKCSEELELYWAFCPFCGKRGNG